MMNNEDNPKFWENIYKNDDAGWDLGGPTPVFVKNPLSSAARKASTKSSGISSNVSFVL